MQIMGYWRGLLLLGGLIFYAQLSAQSLDSALTEDTTRLSEQLIRDSLETAMLQTSVTYRQVERLLRSLPAYSSQLNLIPSVLPIDVPLIRFRVSSQFGYRFHPVHQRASFHRGVDVVAPVGMIVKATAHGIVKRVGHDPALGTFVQLRHAFGFETIYGHLSGYCVRPGQTVGRNQELGRVGRTGLTTGPHLHYSIKKNGSDVDPFGFCFLLRRRLQFYLEKSKTSGASVVDSTNGLSSKGE